MAKEKTNDTATQEVGEVKELQLLQAKSDAAFALTPVGQELKRFEVMQRMGQMYAVATVVPDTYKGNVANCAIALDMAMRIKANPLMVMQNLYMVHGNPGWSSKFLIATINTCGRFTPLRYECNGKEGDEYGWRCYAYEASDKNKEERLEGTWVTWAMVKSEGWLNKSGSKWKTMPEVMFRYRAAAFWQRMYAPEISMGLNTAEELNDVEDVSFVELRHTAAKIPSVPTVDVFDEDENVSVTVETATVETVDTETGEVIQPENAATGGIFGFEDEK